MRNGKTQSGFTILETLIGMAILTVVSSSVYLAYSSVIQIVQSGQYNSASLNAIESRIETVRNMRYEDVGVVGGVPAGQLPQTETIMVGTTPLTMHTYVRNIDDPFDGTLGGTPNDTAPADYKLVEVQVTCNICTRYNVIAMTTYLAPKNLESSSKRGNLFVRVFDAKGVPVSGAIVRVTNTLVNPAIDLTDVTNVSGLLQLVDIATSSAGYHITASKTGYTTDQTYAPGNSANPLKPDATVASQQLTIASLEIDHTSTLTIQTRDQFCVATAGFDVAVTGGKLKGTAPDVPKYSSAVSTTSTGDIVLDTIEWDTYTLRPTDTTLDIAGVIAPSLLSVTIDPGTNHSVRWMTTPHSGNALVVSVTDASGLPLTGASVHVMQTGYDQTRTSGVATINQTDWQIGTYTDKSGMLDASSAGQLSLVFSNGSYASASTEWLISNTYDMGTTSANFTTLNWNPIAQPAQTGANSIAFQVAANNDTTTWNWIGPDGTAGTFFTAPEQALPASITSSRYIRYRVYLKTADGSVTPTLTDASLGFTSGCMLSGQAYFNEMPAGTYTVEVTKSGYQPFTVPQSINDSWQRMVIPLNP